MSQFDRAAKRESLPVEQGTRDTLQLVINALSLARNAQSHFGVMDHVSTAITHLQEAMTIQGVQPVDAEGQGELVQSVVSALVEDRFHQRNPAPC